MATTSALSEARSTCDGLHRLIQKISQAAVDIDKGGSSSYEMLALIASANTCVINLETQLTIIESSALDNPKVHPIKRLDSNENPDTGHTDPQTTRKISNAK